jgi:hypothetical protein
MCPFLPSVFSGRVIGSFHSDTHSAVMVANAVVVLAQRADRHCPDTPGDGQGRKKGHRLVLHGILFSAGVAFEE